MFELNLAKETEAFQLNLKKEGVNIKPCEVAMVLDVSPSFHDEHESYTQGVIDKLVPWGITFDKDKSVQCVLFSATAEEIDPITSESYKGYITKKVMTSHIYTQGDTRYGPALDVLSNKAKTLADKVMGMAGELWGFVTGKKPPTKAASKTLVFFITDGENSDRRDAVEAMRNLPETHFVLFVCVNNECDSIDWQFEGIDKWDKVVINNYDAFTKLDTVGVSNVFLTDKVKKFLNV